MRTDTGSARALCFVVDDEPAIGRFLALALGNLGVGVEQFLDLPSMNAALAERTPVLIFLDVSLGASDAIDAIRHLAAEKYPGTVQLMSGRDAMLLDDVKLIGERHGLRMRPALTKPFRVDAIKRIMDEEKYLSGPVPQDGHVGIVAAATEGKQWPDVDLGEALDRGWVEVWYQPKIDLRGQGLIGAEGLARMRHPEHGLLPPAAFIPASDINELVALADFTLRVGLRDSVGFADSGFPIRLAVNVPVEALVALPIAAIVRECLPEERDRRTGIILEVTEDQVIRDISTAHEIATQLRIHGIGLALDDFGSGYSSLSRLKELPFAELKLDRSFVTGCGVDAGSAALCRTVVELAHRFGCLAVAEGVETADDLAAIRGLGCDLAQGYFFARPMPMQALLEGLRAYGPAAAFDAAWAKGDDGNLRAIA
jgi:EAL domain-containing protein (putative c-di-GMP-specific phosphodiesterase class I)